MTWEEKWESLHLSPESRGFIRDYYRADQRGYVTDLSTEFADNDVDIYTSDLMDWASEHIYDVENAIDEFGWSGNFLDAIRMAQYMVTENTILNDRIELRWALKIAKDIVEDKGLDLGKIDFEEFEFDTDEIDTLWEEVKEWIENVSVLSLR